MFIGPNKAEQLRHVKFLNAFPGGVAGLKQAGDGDGQRKKKQQPIHSLEKAWSLLAAIAMQCDAEHTDISGRQRRRSWAISRSARWAPTGRSAR